MISKNSDDLSEIAGTQDIASSSLKTDEISKDVKNNVVSMLDFKNSASIRRRKIIMDYLHDPLYDSVMFEELEYWIQEYGDVNCQDKHGRTILMLAAQDGKLDVMDALLNSWANVHLKDGDWADALSWWISSMNTPENEIRVIKKLLEHWANINSQDWDWDSALISAVRRWQIHMIKFLADSRSDLDMENYYWETALSIASEKRETEIKNLLLKLWAKKYKRIFEEDEWSALRSVK
ncbi:MAG: ankyrin repeat protein [uncultured bacterium (gcode 4)]|uniref:Ankyrin repeat protein n=1 Tax=uncultured bacterium (gcode 4) TaxID=1234023 RepID=K2G3H9_9BACT|nr:MAG: ankyrin repeat protein [uncultured bacterium (gcode 4)]